METKSTTDERFLWSDLVVTAQVVFADSRAALIEQLDAAVAHCARQASRYGAKAVMGLEVSFTPEGREATLYHVEPGGACILSLASALRDEVYPAWVDAGPSGSAHVRMPKQGTPRRRC